TTIGFFPIRDIWLPNVAEHFAADAGAHRGAPGHHPARRGENAGAQAAEHGGHFGGLEIDAAARPADPLDPGDDFFAVRSVLQVDPNHLADELHLEPRLRFFVHHLESLDVAFVFE